MQESFILAGPLRKTTGRMLLFIGNCVATVSKRTCAIAARRYIYFSYCLSKERLRHRRRVTIATAAAASRRFSYERQRLIDAIDNRLVRTLALKRTAVTLISSMQ